MKRAERRGQGPESAGKSGDGEAAGVSYPNRAMSRVSHLKPHPGPRPPVLGPTRKRPLALGRAPAGGQCADPAGGDPRFLAVLRPAGLVAPRRHGAAAAVGQYPLAGPGVALGTLLLGVPLAWLTVMCEFPGRRILDWALMLPFALPAYVLAFVFVGVLDFAGPVQAGLRDSLACHRPGRSRCATPSASSS